MAELRPRPSLAILASRGREEWLGTLTRRGEAAAGVQHCRPLIDQVTFISAACTAAYNAACSAACSALLLWSALN